ncbi:hypothetical protein GN958_ATG20399 [Phytophthora infestans]|uniref:Uncharacterized protein n=1 Tax=Phytophthora infestans TaxID=4787 RepID=A0A8S9TSD2_PHYIN|nr:hypothetical protein GN958_ATG20399 [Phytophthora infestans]
MADEQQREAASMAATAEFLREYEPSIGAHQDVASKNGLLLVAGKDGETIGRETPQDKERTGSQSSITVPQEAQSGAKDAREAGGGVDSEAQEDA